AWLSMRDLDLRHGHLGRPRESDHMAMTLKLRDFLLLTSVLRRGRLVEPQRRPGPQWICAADESAWECRGNGPRHKCLLRNDETFRVRCHRPRKSHLR